MGVRFINIKDLQDTNFIVYNENEELVY